MTDLFTSVDIPTNDVTDPLEALVGEGKKFKDTAALAKSRLEADTFIDQLQRENRELREKTSSQATVDEIMTHIRALAPKPPVVEPSQTPQNQNQATPDDITRLVSEALQKRTAEERLASNRRLVEEKVLERWGSDAQINLNKKAKELGVSIEHLQKLALETPSIFFEVTGLNRTATSPAPLVAPRSQNQIVPQNSDGSKRNKAFYDGLKARDFQTYISPKVQNQMMKDALAMGDDFLR